MNQKNQTLTQFLMSHKEKQPVSFHMPGHKGSAIYREHGYGPFLDSMMDCDITEIPGADNLYQTEGILKDTMERYRRLYGVKESYLLINGSSGGLIAAILASVPRGGKLILARNCHKSIFNALSLGDITPVYAYPETISEYGILGAVSPEEIGRCMDEHPDASAVILPSPNYYGICSDVAAIAETVHSRGKVLIIDQAHGAHLAFFAKHGLSGFPAAAEAAGADLVINSIHKTLASFTQTALLNVCTDRVDKYDLEDRLQAIESTSPSYPLMATLDINADLLENSGSELMRDWAESLQWFYDTAEKEVPGLRIMRHELLDFTKVNIDMSAYGLNGNQLEDLLMEKDIFIELVTGNILMCMTGIGNKRCDFERLLAALKEIAETRGLRADGADAPEQPKALTASLKMAAVPVRKERIKLEDAAGRVCASSVIPYPPGIPIVCPGEIFDEEVIAYVAERRRAEEKVIGVDELGRVAVGRNE